MELKSVLIGFAGALTFASCATAGGPRLPPPTPTATRVTAPAPTTPLFDRIDDALTAGRVDEASTLLARASSSDPSPRLALEAAELALATGDLKTAEAGFTALTSDKELSARAYQGLGLARLRKGETILAIASLDSALAVDPNLVRSLIARGVAADESKDWNRAEASYDRALELKPDSAVGLTDRGYSRLSRGRFAEAISDLRRALVIDPQMNAARTDLQLALAASGDYKEAFAGATKITLARDLNTVGFAAMARGDYAVAETYFTRAMEINPEFDHTAWANLIYVKQLAHAAAPGGSVTP